MFLEYELLGSQVLASMHIKVSYIFLITGLQLLLWPVLLPIIHKKIGHRKGVIPVYQLHGLGYSVIQIHNQE